MRATQFITELFDPGTALPLEWERMPGPSIQGVKSKDELYAPFTELLPLTYKQWYEMTQGKRYYTNSEKKTAAKTGVKLDYELPKEVTDNGDAEEDEMPF